MPPPPQSFEIKMPATAVMLFEEPVFLLVSQHALGCTVQIRVHIFLLKALQSAPTSCAAPSRFFFFLSFLPACTVPNLSPSLISPLPFSVFQSSSKHEVFSAQHRGRQLLGIASKAESQAALGPDPLTGGPSEVVDR